MSTPHVVAPMEATRVVMITQGERGEESESMMRLAPMMDGVMVAPGVTTHKDVGWRVGEWTLSLSLMVTTWTTALKVSLTLILEAWPTTSMTHGPGVQAVERLKSAWIAGQLHLLALSV